MTRIGTSCSILQQPDFVFDTWYSLYLIIRSVVQHQSARSVSQGCGAGTTVKSCSSIILRSPPRIDLALISIQILKLEVMATLKIFQVTSKLSFKSRPPKSISPAINVLGRAYIYLRPEAQLLSSPSLASFFILRRIIALATSLGYACTLLCEEFHSLRACVQEGALIYIKC